jgi:hypothetical protein
LFWSDPVSKVFQIISILLYEISERLFGVPFPSSRAIAKLESVGEFSFDDGGDWFAHCPRRKWY